MSGAMDTLTVVDRLRLRLEALTARMEEQAAGIAQQRALLTALERAHGRMRTE